MHTSCLLFLSCFFTSQTSLSFTPISFISLSTTPTSPTSLASFNTGSSRGSIASFKVMDILNRANEIESTLPDSPNKLPMLHLEVGQPMTSAPSTVIKKAQTTLSTNKIGYTNAFGLPQLQQKIKDHYVDKYKIDPSSLSTDQIVVTTGSSAGFMLTFLGAFDRDDTIAVASSGYPCYRNICQTCEINVDTIEINSEYKITGELLQKRIDERKELGLKPLNGLILSSPSNPTGSMLSREELEHLCKVCHENEIRFISDEIYHGIVYDKSKGEATALSFSKSAIVINSFSKYYSMSGWRLGWLVVPPELVSNTNALQQNLFINAPTLSQNGGLLCWDEDTTEELEENVKEYKKARDLILESLERVGISDVAPADGAFYIYMDISPFISFEKGLTSIEFCRDFLETEHVAICDGRDFEDPSTDRGGRRIRMSYAGGSKVCAEAMERFERFWVNEWLPKLSK